MSERVKFRGETHKYLVCFEATYGFSTTKFDEVVDWNGRSVDGLKEELREIIREKYCNGRDTSIGITLTGIFKLET